VTTLIFILNFVFQPCGRSVTMGRHVAHRSAPFVGDTDPSNTWFLGPTWFSSSQTVFRSVQPFQHISTVCPTHRYTKMQHLQCLNCRRGGGVGGLNPPSYCPNPPEYCLKLHPRGSVVTPNSWMHFADYCSQFMAKNRAPWSTGKQVSK